MEDAKVFLEDGLETTVNGIFYIFNSRYYFIYTMKEQLDDDYVQLYVVQVCKEIQNTGNGPVDTGYLLGVEIKDASEWSKVQESIIMIVDEKKTGNHNSQIQYLPINMLNNLKIISKNRFKIITYLLKDIFNLDIVANQPISTSEKDLNVVNSIEPTESVELTEIQQPIQPVEPVELAEIQQPSQASESVELAEIQQPIQPIESNQTDKVYESKEELSDDVIVDYRSKFFEQQDKNKQLEEEIKSLQGKLDSIKNII